MNLVLALEGCSLSIESLTRIWRGGPINYWAMLTDAEASQNRLSSPDTYYHHCLYLSIIVKVSFWYLGLLDTLKLVRKLQKKMSPDTCRCPLAIAFFSDRQLTSSSNGSHECASIRHKIDTRAISAVQYKIQGFVRIINISRVLCPISIELDIALLRSAFFIALDCPFLPVYFP